MARMRRIASWMATFTPVTALADPLDYDSYTHQNPRDFWMSQGDFGWLLTDYGLFALAVVAAGWIAFRRPDLWHRIEGAARAPLRGLAALAERVGGWESFGGTLIHVLRLGLGALMLAAWVFFCQWLRHIGLGALAMAGLALAGLVLVRALRAGEQLA